MNVNQKVKIVRCELHPEYVGAVGTIVKKIGDLYKVKVGSHIIADYAAEDCLQVLRNADNAVDAD